MKKFVHAVKYLVHEMIPPATFFFVSFQVIAFTRSLMLRQYGVDATTFVEATIAALVAAKVVLLADLLPFINRFPGRPLIYNILWKTMIYLAAALAVRYLEAFVHFYRLQGQVLGATRHMLDEVVWPRFWAIQIWLLVLLLVYCTMHELVRALGADRVRELFFGVSSRAKTAAKRKTDPPRNPENTPKAVEILEFGISLEFEVWNLKFTLLPSHTV